jgi:hypothetical protein
MVGSPHGGRPCERRGQGPAWRGTACRVRCRPSRGGRPRCGARARCRGLRGQGGASGSARSRERGGWPMRVPMAARPAPQRDPRARARRPAAAERALLVCVRLLTRLAPGDRCRENAVDQAVASPDRRGRHQTARPPRRSGKAQVADLTVRRRTASPPASRPRKRTRTGRSVAGPDANSPVEVSGSVPSPEPPAAALPDPDPVDPPDPSGPPGAPASPKELRTLPNALDRPITAASVEGASGAAPAASGAPGDASAGSSAAESPLAMRLANPDDSAPTLESVAPKTAHDVADPGPRVL